MITEDKPLRPENCKNLTNIKVNVPVWNAMPTKAKKLDFKLQEIQRTNVNGAIWLAQAIDELLQLQKQQRTKEKPLKLDNVVKKCNLTVNMLAQSYHKTNLFRRQIIKAELAPKYRDICADTHPYSTELFGDISKIVTDLESQAKLTVKMAPKKYFSRKASQPTRFRYSQRSDYQRTKPYNNPYQNDYYYGYYPKSKNDKTRGRSRPHRRGLRGRQH